MPDHLLASDTAYQEEERDVDEGGQKSEAELASVLGLCAWEVPMLFFSASNSAIIDVANQNRCSSCAPS